ncbi:S-layer family protein, partial [Limnohabitans sp. Rim28]|uniref:beta strand repeat-containing protein n=1 Tax=Limnohabitans sp. Rim28 TaxID=1100720 RepID=UPI000685C8E4
MKTNKKINITTDQSGTQLVKVAKGQVFQILIDGQPYIGQKTIHGRRLLLKRQADALVLELEGRDQPLVEVADFFEPQAGSDNASLLGDIDPQTLFVAEQWAATGTALTGQTTPGQIMVPDASLIASAAKPESQASRPAHAKSDKDGGGWAWGLGGLALAALGGGGGGSDKQSEPKPEPQPEPEPGVLVSGTFLAGPVVDGHGLSVLVFDLNGNRIGQGAIDSAGRYSVDVGSYRGGVVLKVIDANVGNDYMDEALQRATDLGAVLMAVGTVQAGTNPIHVNPATTAAAVLAGLKAVDVTGAGADLAAQVGRVEGADTSAQLQAIEQANKAIARLIGVSSSLVQTGPVSTVLPDGTANSANVGANDAQRIGQFAAVLSGLSMKNGGDKRAAIEQFDAWLVASNGTLEVSSAGAAALILGSIGPLITPDQIALLLNKDAQTQASAFVASGASALTPMVARFLTADQMASIANLQSIPVDALKVMKPQSLEGLSASQVAALTSGQLNALTPEQKATLNGVQLDALVARANSAGAALAAAQSELDAAQAALSSALSAMSAPATAGQLAAVESAQNTLKAKAAAATSAANAATAAVTAAQAAATAAGETINTSAISTAAAAAMSDAGTAAGEVALASLRVAASGNTSTATTPDIPPDIPPAITALAVSYGAAEVGTAGNSAGETIVLTLTFSESVNGLSSGSNNTVFTVAGTGVSASWGGSGSTRTLTYTIQAGQNGQAAIDEAALKSALQTGLSDVAGNALSISGSIANIDSTALTVIDNTAPTLLSSTPGDQEFLRADANITLTFNEAIALGSNGTITLKALDGASDVVINVASHGGQLSISGSTLTINPTSALDDGKQYAVQISSTAIRDTAGTAFAGIASTDTSTLNFATLVAGNGVSPNQVANGYGGFVVNAAGENESFGVAVASAGDVNGDGYDDFIVGTSTWGGVLTNGTAYVVFGKTNTTAVETTDLAAGTDGFAILGENTYDQLGYSVSAAGDVNGDGKADLLVGAVSYSFATGRSYVVYGKDSTAAVDLDDIENDDNSLGFAITGENMHDGSGGSVAAAGDFNGDGLADLVIGADGVNNYTGKTYVVYGQLNRSNLDLTNLAGSPDGFVIQAENVGDNSGYSVSAAGDVNGDGLTDLIVGAIEANAGDGRSYVVFGGTGNSTIDLTDVANGTGGFVITGEAGDEGRSGVSVAAAGDVNGDGLADVVIGADHSTISSPNTGRSYVVFGKSNDTTAVNLSDIASGNGGFALQGEAVGDYAGFSVSAAGDINGDGLSDLIVGAPGTNAWSGKSYVVYGRTSDTLVQLSDVAAGTGGFAILGETDSGELGTAVSAAGDINGDGFADLLIGAPSVNNYSGSAYVIFGGHQDRSVVDFLGTASANSLTGTSAAETFAGGDGNDTISGGGGSDVIWAGRGDDTVVLNSTNVAALQAAFNSGGQNTTQLARVDGGTGFDTLRLNGSHLDLTLVANPGASAPGGFSRISSIEAIDLASDSASNT